MTSFGWDEEFADSFATHGGPGHLPGRIVRVDRGRVDAVVPDGDDVRTVSADTAQVATGDPMRAPCTGDWAVIDIEHGVTGGVDGVVRSLLPRRTAIVRSSSSKRSEAQVLAANVDHAVIAVSLAAELDLGRIERFLSLAWESGAEPLVVLTKADLVQDPAVLSYLVSDTESVAPGVQVLPVSSETGEGVEVLSAVLAGGTSVLLGQSGAGKSTLANALLGESVQDVRATRDQDGKGRHTTTTRDLLRLPWGGVLIDTPGLRGVGIWDAESGLAQTFSDIESLAGECRFHDCAHLAEPGCAVLGAIERGALPERRLESYRKLVRENQWVVAKSDARVRSEMREGWKQMRATYQHMGERKRGGPHR
ncbi:ribosome small subunit-dependent GTPase A [Streptomyces stramineus]|uniref:Small ribosomal subunit biogenesis GTPase RsgA n=1 Tax=Streptomyces stramineus TaxID=173861 RepID=A0ABP3KKC2_9ACTN